jgi:hypothetical protein
MHYSQGHIQIDKPQFNDHNTSLAWSVILLHVSYSANKKNKVTNVTGSFLSKHHTDQNGGLT